MSRYGGTFCWLGHFATLRVSRLKFLFCLVFDNILNMEKVRGINYEVELKFHPDHSVDYEAISRSIEKDLDDIKEMGGDSEIWA